MSYSPQQLAQALAQPVSLFGPAGPMQLQQRTSLDPMQMQGGSSGGSLASPPSPGMLAYMKGLMGQQGGVPPNPYAMGGGGYMDAGSMPMFTMA